MLGTLFRVLVGFALACLAAGVAVVAYVITPLELANLAGDAFDSRLLDAGALALRAATHTAIFAAPFALILAAISEWQALRSPVFYILGGIAIAVAGFLAQYSSEGAGQHTVLNDYAIRAFLTTGLLSGLVYWMFSGRHAGGAHGEPAPQTAVVGNPAPIEAKPAAKPAPSKPIEITARENRPEVKAAAKSTGSKA